MDSPKVDGNLEESLHIEEPNKLNCKKRRNKLGNRGGKRIKELMRIKEGRENIVISDRNEIGGIKFEMGTAGGEDEFSITVGEMFDRLISFAVESLVDYQTTTKLIPENMN